MDRQMEEWRHEQRTEETEEWRAGGGWQEGRMDRRTERWRHEGRRDFHIKYQDCHMLEPPETGLTLTAEPFQASPVLIQGVGARGVLGGEHPSQL